MRNFLLLLLLFVNNTAMAQHFTTGDTPLVVKQLPKEGVLLDKGWKFRAGDQFDWAKPDAIDTAWKPLSINQPTQSFLKATNGGKGWLRLNFILDSTLWQLPIALLITQFGASEVYLDDKLIQRFGTLSVERSTSFNPHGQPIPLPLAKQWRHQLTIHFLSDAPTSSWLLKRAQVPPLSVRLQPTAAAIGNQHIDARKARSQFGFVTVHGVFGLLFLLIFLFYPRQPLNLYFSLYNICLTILTIIGMYFTEGQFGLSSYVWLQILSDFIGRATGSSIMAFIALALYGRIPPFFKWLIWYILTVDFIGPYLFPTQYLLINYLVRAAFMFSLLWLTIRAFRNLNLKNWFIGTVALFSFVVNLNFFLYLFWKIDSSYFDPIYLFVLMPSMVIYLALNHAQTNASLERQLVHVKNLSEENIKKEQEKQQILTEQKELLEQQVIQRTAALNQSLNELNATQAQLVQREKMASLGELTAGIAHEIQNPLNFVNNFSETNVELIEEAQTELKAGNHDEASIILNDIKENEQKIASHGKRADAIVRGMLQHSRTSTGDKELTDINTLVDEYLRLSYHGVRAKEKEFTAALETNLDNTIGLVSVVPQDLGRVLLNLFNNAFYATLEKKRRLNGIYEPVVSVRTTRINGTVEIQVQDNGTGIPKTALGKIFQPFFTTKPSGEGTGLGLSLSFDIITKGHSGELTVESAEGEGATFVVRLPV